MSSGKDGVLSIHERRVYWPHTTRSWNFLNLPQHNDPTRLKFENDVVIGMVDTGIWTDSASFSDEGLPPPPANWKGVCPTNFTCNKYVLAACPRMEPFINHQMILLLVRCLVR
jgi:hypothetical protein